MSDLEHIERERYGIVALSGTVALVAGLALGLKLLIAALFAVAIGLLAGGVYAGRKLCGAHLWEHLQAEAKVHGYASSKSRVWVGNLAPGVAALLFAGLIASAV